MPPHTTCTSAGHPQTTDQILLRALWRRVGPLEKIGKLVCSEANRGAASDKFSCPVCSTNITVLQKVVLNIRIAELSAYILFFRNYKLLWWNTATLSAAVCSPSSSLSVHLHQQTHLSPGPVVAQVLPKRDKSWSVAVQVLSGKLCHATYFARQRCFMPIH